MLPSVIEGGSIVAAMLSPTHSAARREDSSVPFLSSQTVTVKPALAGPYGRVADESVDPSDELVDLVVLLLELVEELGSAFPGIAANDCVHHCLLEMRRGASDPIARAARLNSWGRFT